MLPVSDIQRASWIKSLNNRSTPLVLIFNTPEIQSFVSIPGEAALSKMYEYKNKPLYCTRCINYGHTTKRCESPVVCGKCGEGGHSADGCDSDSIKCLHCPGQHLSGSKECEMYKRELEIVSVQQKQGISRNQAKFLIERNKPLGQQFNFSRALKRPSSNHTSQNTASQIDIRHTPTVQPRSKYNIPHAKNTVTKKKQIYFSKALTPEESMNTK